MDSIDQTKSARLTPPSPNTSGAPVPFLHDSSSDRVRPLRTYQSDIAETLQHTQTSVTKIAVAEEKKRIARHEPSPSEIAEARARRERFLKMIGVTVALILIIGGAGTIAGVFYLRTIPKDSTKEFPPPGLVAYEAKKEILTDGFNRAQLIDSIRSARETASLPLGRVSYLYFTKNNTSPSLLSTRQFLDMLDTSTPEATIRSLDPTFFYGMTTTGYNDAFLIFKTDSFPIAFSGMLDWESSLDQDLTSILIRINTASGTPRTTTNRGSALKGSITKSSFLDEVFESNDARVLRDESGAIKLLYSFLDRTTLVIASSPEALTEVRERLHISKLAR
jgi:hypothetical protein